MRENAKDALGCALGTARARLVKLIIFGLLDALGRTACFRCSEPMTSATISIDHVIPWLHAENAQELYFDVSNIDFSHVVCNSNAARRAKPQEHGGGESGRRNCSCDLCKARKAEYMSGYRS